MALEDYRNDLEMCHRCSVCKFVPLERVTGYEHATVCPSIARHDFHAYSGGGRLAIGVAMLDGQLEYSDKLLDVIYDCQMCGACDVSCKYAMDIEVLGSLEEMRIRCVEDGQTLPVLDRLIKSMRAGGPMVLGPKAKRGQWAEGLDCKELSQERAQVAYFAGCRTIYDRSMWGVAHATLALMREAGVEAGIARKEICCGGRAYQMGYARDALAQAEQNMDALRRAGVETLVTSCAECRHAFDVLYDQLGVKGELEVLHSAEYFHRLVAEGRLTPAREVSMTVTYHDPCHLGRQGEPYIHWEGGEVPGHVHRYDPPKELRRGTNGVYDAPRALLESIPGVRVVEMDRTKEYAWCCGAGGGVRESNPDFARWTAAERITEAEATGGEALVSGCPGCEKSFVEAIDESGSRLAVYDVVEVLARAIL